MKIYIVQGWKESVFIITRIPPKLNDESEHVGVRQGWLGANSYYWPVLTNGFATSDKELIEALVSAEEYPVKENQYLEWDTEKETGWLYTYG